MWKVVVIESIGWLSTALFLISIVMPRRMHMHILGPFTSITTCIYAFTHLRIYAFTHMRTLRQPFGLSG